MSTDDQPLGIKGIAKLIGLGYDQTLARIRNGELPFVWRTGKGGEYRAMREDVLAYRDGMRVKGGGA